MAAPGGSDTADPSAPLLVQTIPGLSLNESSADLGRNGLNLAPAGAARALAAAAGEDSAASNVASIPKMGSGTS